MNPLTAVQDFRPTSIRWSETSVLAPWARRAMVATDRAISGFRMYGALFERQVDGSAVGVFTTLDDAIEWVTP